MSNNTCKCCNENVLEVTSVSISGNSYFLIVDSDIIPKNGCKYVIVIPCRVLPPTTTLNQVFVAINFRNYPLTDRCIGNNVYNDQLRFVPTNCKGNKVLRVVFGNNTPHFKIISQDLPCSTYELSSSSNAVSTAKTSTAAKAATKATV